MLHEIISTATTLVTSFGSATLLYNSVSAAVCQPDEAVSEDYQATLGAACCLQFVPAVDDADVEDDESAVGGAGNEQYLQHLPDLHAAGTAAVDINITRQVHL